VIEHAITAAVSAAIAPLVEEMRALRAEVARLRRADGPTLLRMAEVAERYHYPVSTQREHIRRGLLRAVKRGRVVLVDVSALEPPTDSQVAAAAAEARAR
jgi:hypothetical protein